MQGFRRSGRQTTLAGALTLAATAILLGGAAPAASAGTKVFHPVRSRPHMLVFRPHGVSPMGVRRAVVRLRHGDRRIRRHVRVRRLRSALRGGKRIRLRTGRHVRFGRLLVRVRRDAGAKEGFPTTACSLADFDSDTVPGACWRPYSDQSPFNRVLPDSAPLAANSAAIVDRTDGFGEMNKFSGGSALGGDDWNHPIYFSDSSDPLYTVHCAYSADWGACEVEGEQIHIPAAARPAGGGDAHLAVIDKASGTEYDFWQVRSKPASGGILVVSYGGQTSVSDDGLGSKATAASFGLAAGVIRPSELEAGSIDHALFMVVKCTNGTAVWPAPPTGTGTSCSSRGLSNSGAPAMGQHYFLAMSDAEIAALDRPAWTKTILRAMARYGMFVGDTGGISWGIQFESGTSQTSFGYEDPWVRLGKQLGLPTWTSGGRTYYVYDMQTAVSWGSRLAVAEPCVARGTC